MRNRVALAALVLTGTISGLASAKSNDLDLANLGTTVGTPGSPDYNVVADNQSFRSLASELGVVIAPKFLAPADTLGFNGFQFSVETAYTTISKDAQFWCGVEAASCPGDRQPSAGLMTTGFFVRKGIWLPLPSFEIGAGAVNVLDSSMWAGQAYAKFALHEGFQHWPVVPSLAVRGAVSRLFGSAQLDLTVASFDASISKAFGIYGTVSLEPYAGYNYLWIIPRSGVIDKTPTVDAWVNPEDMPQHFVFPTQDNIVRQRFFGGFKLLYYVFAITAEVDMTSAGASIDDRVGSTSCDSAGASLDSCDAKDQADKQWSGVISLGVDF